MPIAEWGSWFIACLGGGLVAFIVIIATKESREYHEFKKKYINQEPKLEEEKVVYRQAKAVKKRIHIYYTSIKQPKSVMQYWVKFSFDDGTEKEYEISKQIFDRIEEGEDGTLVLYNGVFFDFGAGEEIVEETE